MPENKLSTFKESYAILKQNAEKLRTQSAEDVDIDQLVPLVEQSVDAYRVAKERIEAVKAALKKHLPEVTPEPPSRPAPPAQEADGSGLSDDDIPF